MNDHLGHAKMLMRVKLFPSFKSVDVTKSPLSVCLNTGNVNGNLHLEEQDGTMLTCLFRYILIYKIRILTESPHSPKVNWSLATDFSVSRLSQMSFNRTDYPNIQDLTISNKIQIS